MKPNDENGKLPPEKRPFRVLIIAGSGRREALGLNHDTHVSSKDSEGEKLRQPD